MSRRRRIDRALLALGGLVVVSSAVRFALSSGVDAPWIAPDEQLYGLLGRSLVAGDGLSVLGERIPYYSLVYPLLVGLPFVWSGLGRSANVAAPAGARDVADGRPGVRVGAPDRRCPLGACRSKSQRSHPRPRLQRALHERGALLPRRDARRRPRWRPASAADARAAGLPAGCGGACKLGRDCRRSDSPARSFWRSVSWPSPRDLFAPFRRLLLTIGVLGAGAALWVGLRVQRAGSASSWARTHHWARPTSTRSATSRSR